jgi:putative colanic acid biosynthesis glycosyltransferase
VNTAANRGGASLSAQAINQAVAARGVANTFVVGDAHGPVASDVISLGLRGPRRYLASFGYRVLGREGMLVSSRWQPLLATLHEYDLVHLHNVHGYYLPSAVLEQLLQKPCIWTLHDFWLATGGPAFPPVAQGLSNWRYPAEWINRSTRRRRKLHDMLEQYGPTLVAVSEDMLQRLRALDFTYKNVQVIPHGLFSHCEGPSDRNPAAKHQGPKLAAKSPSLLFVSAQVLNPLKGFEIFLAALDSLGGNVRGLDVVVVGEIPHAKAARLKAAYPYIRFVGSVSGEAITSHYRNCDIYVSPTLDETYGRGVVEALVEGSLVVCSDLPVLREIGGSWPRFFEPGNAESLALTLNEALRSRDAVDRTTQAMEIRRRHSLSRMGEAYVDLYHQVLQSKQ